jgi:predicted SprT family Zn-dependent metalloprotease
MAGDGKAIDDTKQAERQGGLRCPSCQCPHLPVSYTRHRTDKIMRVRKCRNCGRRLVTYERLG